MNLPKISAVITTYKQETVRLLDFLMGSLQRVNYPKELFDIKVVAPKRMNYLDGYESSKNVKILRPTPEEFTYTYALNHGIKNSDGEFIWILNDDTIVSKNSLKHLLESFRGTSDKSLVVSLTNTDNGVFFEGLFQANVNGKPKAFPERFYRYADWREYVYDLSDADSVYPFCLVHQPFVCPVSMLMSRRAFNEIGPFDEEILMSGEEIDYCMRAVKLGYRCKIQLASLVWHFGGSSNVDISPEQKVERVIPFYKKHGFIPPSDTATMNKVAQIIKERGIMPNQGI